MSDFSAGQQVRLVTDPGQIGTLSGNTRMRVGKVVYHIRFPQGPSWQPESAIELFDDNNDPYQLLAEGKFGRLNDLRRNLTFIQLSGRLANLVYSMDTTNTEFYAYQYKPVLAFLESPSKGLLIADEVGLGKTIEAGLIWTELRARLDARRLLVICPAMLREKWKAELSHRFGIEASLMNADELLSELNRPKHQVPTGRAIVCSYSGLRPPKEWDAGPDVVDSARAKLARLFNNSASDDPLFDLVIFDEAHNMRNPESSTSKLGKLIRDVTEHMILLSATPINLHDNDLFQLLNLIDEDTFSNEHVFPRIIRANKPLLKAQQAALDKTLGWSDIVEKLQEAQQHDMLTHSHQLKALIDMDLDEEDLEKDSQRIEIANQIERCNLLSKVITRTQKKEVTELRVIREPKAPHVEMTDTEKDFYQQVTEAVRRYAVGKDIHEAFLLAMPQRQVSSCMYAALRAWRKRTEFDENSSYEALGVTGKSDKKTSPLMEHIGAHVIPNINLEELRDNDSKFNVLKKELMAFFADNPDEKVIVFAYFRETLIYLEERFAELGIDSQVLMGGMRQSKQEVIDTFKDSAKCRILLASEVASEGVDLQFCKVLVNYDLPWNPMRIEQRIGRIDRHGQKSKKIHILNFCYNDTIDQRIYSRLYARLAIFENTLGDMEAILGEKISDLTQKLLFDDLTPQQREQQLEQTCLAIARKQHEQQELEAKASNLIAHGGHILQEVQTAHDFKKMITENDLIAFVQDYLDKYCQGNEFRQVNPEGLVFDIKLPSQDAVQFKNYINANKLYGLTTLDQGHRVRCVFMNMVVGDTGKNERISQFHPLVRFIGEQLRLKEEPFLPLVSIKLDSTVNALIEPGIYAVVVKRTEFKGLRIEEKLHVRAIKVGADKALDGNTSYDLVNSAKVEGVDWPEVTNEVDLDYTSELFSFCEEWLELDYQREIDLKVNENGDRVGFQIDSVTRHTSRQIRSRLSAIEKLQLKGNTGLIKANEGQITKIKQRFDQRVEELKQQADVKHNMSDVCHALIKVI